MHIMKTAYSNALCNPLGNNNGDEAVFHSTATPVPMAAG